MFNSATRFLRGKSGKNAHQNKAGKEVDLKNNNDEKQRSFDASDLGLKERVSDMKKVKNIKIRKSLFFRKKVKVLVQS